MMQEYPATEPSRAEVDALTGPAVLEFGTPWCGHCRAAQPLLAAAFADYPGLRHTKIEDASERQLGRTFSIKLWPTLVFLRDGAEVSRLVRPGDASQISQALAQISASTKTR